MKIKFLGTSHGAPMPGRFYQSMLIEENGYYYVFDAGAPVMPLLVNAGIDVNRVRAVFITHLHNDHITGLMDMVTIATWYYTDMHFDVYLPEERAIPVIRAYREAFSRVPDTDRIRFYIVREGLVYDDGNLKVTAYPTDHLEYAYGYLVEGEKKVYITGDMAQKIEDFNTEVSEMPLDLLVTEGAHPSVPMLLDKLKPTGAKKVAVVHISTLAKLDEIRQTAEDVPYLLFAPCDGDEVEI